MDSSDHYYRSLCFWTMGQQYLHLSRVVAEQIVDARNQVVATFWGSKSPDEEAEEFDRQTKWSDARLIEPLMFNFYHGLELTLKGFLLLARGPEATLNHRLANLLAAFTEDYPDETTLIRVFQKYLTVCMMPDILREFVEHNDLPVDRFFESFRYPYDKNLDQNFKHIMLKYKTRETLPFYEDLVEDIRTCLRLAVDLARRNEQAGEQLPAPRQK